jgi:hypothetical protein
VASENIERQMEFILEEQARGAARLRQLEDIVARLEQETRERVKASQHRVDKIGEDFSAL